MSTELKKKEDAKSTTGRYKTVEELMAASGVSAETQNAVSELEKESRLTGQLAVLRTAAGITQELMAEKLGCTQSCISKLECGMDDDITLKQLRTYAEATGERIGLTVGKPLNHVEAIKLHAQGIHHHLQALAKLAHQDRELEAGIQRFYSEALFNMFGIIAKCQKDMPNGDKIEIRLEVSDVSRSRPAIGMKKLPASGRPAARKPAHV